MAIRLQSASSQYLTRTTDLLSYNSNYTMMGWFYLVSDVNNYANFFDLYFTASAVDALQTGADGTTLNCYCQSDAGSIDTNGTNLSLTTWYHLAMTRNGSAIVVYLNGNSNITGTCNIGTRLVNNNMYVGSWGGSGDFPDYRVHSLKFWQEALTQNEVRGEMYSVQPRRTANLYGWWPTFPGSTERYRDWSGNGRTWTAGGGGSPTDEDPPPISWGSKLWQIPWQSAGGGTPLGVSIDPSVYGSAGWKHGVKLWG